MKRLICKIPDHGKDEIIAMCSEPGCSKNRLNCKRCLIDYHQVHSDSMVLIEEIFQKGKFAWYSNWPKDPMVRNIIKYINKYQNSTLNPDPNEAPFSNPSEYIENILDELILAITDKLNAIKYSIKEKLNGRVLSNRLDLKRVKELIEENFDLNPLRESFLNFKNQHIDYQRLEQDISVYFNQTRHAESVAYLHSLMKDSYANIDYQAYLRFKNEILSQFDLSNIQTFIIGLDNELYPGRRTKILSTTVLNRNDEDSNNYVSSVVTKTRRRSNLSQDFTNRDKDYLPTISQSMVQINDYKPVSYNTGSITSHETKTIIRERNSSDDGRSFPNIEYPKSKYRIQRVRSSMENDDIENNDGGKTNYWQKSEIVMGWKGKILGKKIYTALGHHDWVWALEPMDNNRYVLSSSSDKTIKLWETTSKGCVKTLAGHNDTVRSLSYMSDFKLVASGGYDKSIKFWEPFSNKIQTEINLPASVNKVKYIKSRRELASALDCNRIPIWDVEKAVKKVCFEGHTNQVTDLADVEDHRLLASSSWDKSIRLWDFKSGKCCFATLKSHQDWVYSLAYADKLNTLISGGKDGSVKLWDLRIMRTTVTHEGLKYPARSLCYLRSLNQLAVAFGNSVRIMEITDQPNYMDIEAHTEEVLSCTFLEDTMELITAGKDKYLKFWT